MATHFKDVGPEEPHHTKTHFQKRSYAQHQYHDPTYTSFFIMIDFHHSKLFNGMAEEFLRDTLGEVERADKLARFTKNFQKLIIEMPWTFQEIEGLEKAFTFNDLKKNYRGGDDAVLKIKCLESADLLITGLMDMYRDIAIDISRWCEVLPHNMYYFDMYVIVSDARRFHKRKNDTSKKARNDFSNDPRKHFEINTGLAGRNKAHFMLHFKKCNFKLDNGIELLTGISNAEPKLLEGVGLQIGYQIIKYYSKQYMNAFEGTIAENRMAESVVGPQPGQENPPQQASYGDSVSGRANSPSGGAITTNPIEIGHSGSSKEKIFNPGEAANKLKDLAKTEVDGFKKGDKIKELVESKIEGYKNEINRGAEDFQNSIAAKIENAGPNLIGDLMDTAAGAARRFVADTLGGLLLGNVYGVNALSNIQDALNAGSINGIMNLVNKATENNSVAEEGALPKMNIFPPSVSETPLAPENMMPASQSETPLAPANMITPSEPETALSPDNIITPSQAETPLAPDNINSARKKRERKLDSSNVYENGSGDEG